MERRSIGSLDVSVVGVGTNNFGSRLGPDESAAVLDAAIDLGVNFIDTADMYSKSASEEYIGRWLANANRSKVVVATKFGMPWDAEHEGGGTAAYVVASAEESLRRLRTDYIDLLILHRPDPETPLEETLGALQGLVERGLVRELGCSSFSFAQIRESEEIGAGGGARFVNVQNEYSLLHREPEADVLPECARDGIGFVPFRPLARGLLTGKYRRGQDAPAGSRLESIPADQKAHALSAAALDVVEGLISYAEARGHTLLELALAYILARPEVSSVIAGAMTAEQLRSNSEAVGWRLTPAEVAEVAALASS